ncbi:hypothetical protein ZIOFF_067641 [Zingiber officinale]|uniref:DELLA protein n=1 Tax=Zingiber officinale TaxID=94328 RepID=A0A8J5CE41_ZINOF|nr:hypothetical protein ZIOFF_067641 [Zingiber officinale]
MTGMNSRNSIIGLTLCSPNIQNIKLLCAPSFAFVEFLGSEIKDSICDLKRIKFWNSEISELQLNTPPPLPQQPAPPAASLRHQFDLSLTGTEQYNIEIKSLQCISIVVDHHGCGGAASGRRGLAGGRYPTGTRSDAVCAVQKENLKAAGAIVKQIFILAASQGGAMRKVAGYFAEALAHQIYRPQSPRGVSCSTNQAILEAFAGCRRVHVVDFGMRQGLQWPALLQALALRPRGPPSFRLIGIGPPEPDNSDSLQEVGWKLAQLAETIRVEIGKGRRILRRGNGNIRFYTN